MRKILFILICFTLFSCGKDEAKTTSEEERKEEILNTIEGRWKFYRASKTPDFKEVIEFNFKECDQYNYMEFQKDHNSIIYQYCATIYNPETEENEPTVGKGQAHFQIHFRDNEIVFEGAVVVDEHHMYDGFTPIYKYSKDSLIFHSGDTYFEFKKVE